MFRRKPFLVFATLVFVIALILVYMDSTGGSYWRGSSRGIVELRSASPIRSVRYMYGEYPTHVRERVETDTDL